MWQLQQDVAEQLAVRSHLRNPRLDQVIEVARDQVAFQYVRQFQHRAAELFEGIPRLVVQAYLDEHQQAALEVLRVEPGVVAHDDPFALQAPDPFGAGCGRQADLFAQFSERDSSICLQDPQDVAVDLIQFTFALVLGSHSGCPSVKANLAENSRQI